MPNQYKEITYEFVKDQFEKEGCELTSKEYVNARAKLDYVCPKGHKHSITWSDWQKGRRCFYCKYENMKGKKHTEETKKKMSGENSPHWNPLLSDEDRQDRRNYPEYYEWRQQVYTRDNYTCQKCEVMGGNLQAHHIESYSNNPELRTTLTNGITFCEECHKDFHHQYGNSNTKEQCVEFLIKKTIRFICKGDAE